MNIINRDFSSAVAGSGRRLLYLLLQRATEQLLVREGTVRLLLSPFWLLGKHHANVSHSEEDKH